MTKGKGWRLVTTTGRKRVFVGTLLQTINFGNKRIAIFSVPKRERRALAFLSIFTVSERSMPSAKKQALGGRSDT